MFRDRRSCLIRCGDAAQRKTTELRTRFTERTDLWLNARRQVLEFRSRPSNFIAGTGCTSSIEIAFYNSELMVASHIAGRTVVFRFPLWKSKPTTKEKFLHPVPDDEWR